MTTHPDDLAAELDLGPVGEAIGVIVGGPPCQAFARVGRPKLREIDDHPIDAPGEITKVIAAKFDDALHGRAPEYAEWLDPVDEPSKVAS